MIKEIRDYAYLNNIPIIQDQGLAFILDMIEAYNVKSMLEVGSAIGYSSIMLASQNKSLKVVTIEVDIKRYHIAQENISRFNLNDQISVINLDANDYKSDEKYDLIFLDGPKSQYQNMLDNLYENLSDNGIVIVDNLGFHGLVYQEKPQVKRRTRQLVEKIKLFRKKIAVDERFKVFLYDEIGDGMGLLINRKGVIGAKLKERC